MIRFTDIAPEPKPKKAVVPAPEREPVASVAASAPASAAAKPARAPRKPKKSA